MKRKREGHIKRRTERSGPSSSDEVADDDNRGRIEVKEKIPLRWWRIEATTQLQLPLQWLPWLHDGFIAKRRAEVQGCYACHLPTRGRRTPFSRTDNEEKRPHCPCGVRRPRLGDEPRAGPLSLKDHRKQQRRRYRAARTRHGKHPALMRVTAGGRLCRLSIPEGTGALLSVQAIISRVCCRGGFTKGVWRAALSGRWDAPASPGAHL